jgi:hypothetical protein
MFFLKKKTFFLEKRKYLCDRNRKESDDAHPTQFFVLRLSKIDEQQANLL